MNKDEIHFTDLHRWLFGQTPPQFMIEVIIRTVLIYMVLLLVVRQMGKRSPGLRVRAVESAVALREGGRGARWVAGDVLRELERRRPP